MAAPRSRSSNNRIVLALAGFIGVTSALPFVLYERQRRLTGNLYASDKALSPNQVMRGPYVNTGSKDAGPDPDWDHATGRYKGRSPPPSDRVQPPS